jgi:hypothetical protein
MFTLEQQIFIVQCFFSDRERLGRVFDEFQQKFPDFQGNLTNNLPRKSANA